MDTVIDKPPSVATRPPAEDAGENDGQAWKQLRYLNHYRVLLAGLFFAFVASGTPPAPLGSHHPRLFQWTSGVYLVLALASTLAIHRRWFPFKVQVHGHVLLDIAAITLMMYASGGVRSGLGMLLVVAVAGGSLLTEGRTARLFAAIATLAVLSEQLYNKLEGSLPASYTQAGLLGAGFFATAILAHGLARRLRESEALAERRGVDLANMAQLTEYIIQRMQTGILVIDGNGRIRLANHSARALLDNPRLEAGETLPAAAPPLAEQMRRWEQDPEAPPCPFRATPAGASLLPRFARLGSTSGSGILVFLEDTAATTQQAQQMKLASLGRLTASIAHEIRNPLGAISHAGQLLAESSHLDPADLRLTQIIQEHSRRVNTIIENILQLGRGGRSQPETLHLRPWLEQFIAGFCLSEQLDPGRIRLEIHPADTCVRVDAGQLHQILWNLCHNGIHHGGGAHQGRLILRGGLTPDTHSPYLEIIDNGPGIREQDMEHIFEPFFTTAEGGTGLGLYIARELCEGNQARLHCLPAAEGACFRIVFADPRRRQVA
ncbi:MAG TPA: ATPase [Gammaproteobacteria bacterium]|nr:ATPase [Gammaproteobacteria bacterium]